MGAIDIEHAGKHFPGAARPALEDCTVSMQAGELTVLLGPSGCGKTTLLKLVNRLYEPDCGRILIDGTDVRTLPAPQLRRRIGYVIQQVGLFPHLRVGENIATVPRLLGWPNWRIEARIDELLELVGLPRAYRRRRPRELSGGEQQRVGLARALAADPPIMLMDEPFGALDPILRARLQDELLAIQQKLRKTIIFVTHDVEEALRLADRIALMREGRIVQHDRPLALITDPRDDFVRSFLATDDVLRRLSLVPVGAAAPAGSAVDGAPAVRSTDSLRTALSVLLQSGAPTLAVIGADGRPSGRLGFEEIRRAAQR
jgi:osmoprotectant transport system ATP-binding protein